ncbi:MAG TPA: ATPase [Chromatiales bacterium]|nr:ATPase [Chromatiales bacterium]
MADTLTRLIEAELKAEAIVEAANREREQLVHQAVSEARLAEQRFEARIGEIRESFMQKAIERAEQTVAEMQRRFDERKSRLEEAAAQHDKEALDAVIALLLNPQGE